MRLRLSDLEQTVTLGEVWDTLDVGEVMQLVWDHLAHYLDDEGAYEALIETDFAASLQSDIEHTYDSIVAALVD